MDDKKFSVCKCCAVYSSVDLSLIYLVLQQYGVKNRRSLLKILKGIGFFGLRGLENLGYRAVCNCVYVGADLRVGPRWLRVNQIRAPHAGLPPRRVANRSN